MDKDYSTMHPMDLNFWYSEAFQREHPDIAYMTLLYRRTCQFVEMLHDAFLKFDPEEEWDSNFDYELVHVAFHMLYAVIDDSKLNARLHKLSREIQDKEFTVRMAIREVGSLLCIWRNLVEEGMDINIKRDAEECIMYGGGCYYDRGLPRRPTIDEQKELANHMYTIITILPTLYVRV
jgi:hypothetical protein